VGESARERLAAVLAGAVRGRFPPADGGITVLPQPSARDAGVFGFTAHAVVFAEVDQDWVRAQIPDGDLGAPLQPPFLSALSARTGRVAGSIDMLCFAEPLPGKPPLALTPLDLKAGRDPAERPASEEPGDAPGAWSGHHPRIERAYGYRDAVRAWAADGGVVLLGRGVAGRWETAIEVDADRRRRGLGRALAVAARHLVPAGEPLWAQVAPANAASVRAFLAAGFTPVGAEILLAASRRGR
jgi:GNAT superfamily N-acetyltransferase